MSADNVIPIGRRPKPLRTPDLVRCLERLLKQAQKGHLTGIAFIALVGPDGFIADACGIIRENPEEARQLLPALDTRLLRLGKR